MGDTTPARPFGALTELDILRALLRRTNTVAFEYRAVIPGNEAYGDPGVLTIEIAGGSRFLFGEDESLTMVLGPALMTEAERKTSEISLADERELRTARLIADPKTRLLSAATVTRAHGTQGQAWLDPHLIANAPAAALEEFRGLCSRCEREVEKRDSPADTAAVDQSGAGRRSRWIGTAHLMRGGVRIATASVLEDRSLAAFLSTICSASLGSESEVFLFVLHRVFVPRVTQREAIRLLMNHPDQWDVVARGVTWGPIYVTSYQMPTAFQMKSIEDSRTQDGMLFETIECVGVRKDSPSPSITEEVVGGPGT